MEVLWKALLGIINWRIGAAVKFRDVLHGFQAGRGMGTASIEANFLHNVIAMREGVPL